jgi:hypothetical protein
VFLVREEINEYTVYMHNILEGLAMDETVVTDLSPGRPGFDTRLLHVTFEKFVSKNA